MPSILALDQGTTSSRAILFDQHGQPVADAQQEFEQLFPSPGHVEHNPEAIWESQLATAKKIVSSGAVAPEDIAAIGITNQRETVILWEKSTGKPVANAMVWQSRISAPRCQQLKQQGLDATVREKTGLVIDAYFSATKIEHLLNTVDGLRERAQRGEILCGTVDTFLVWRLTGGKTHVTDFSNASRTMLFNIHQLDWDDDLLKLFDIPRSMLPKVVPTSGILGETDPSIFGRAIPIGSCVGDQQAASFGQACFQEGAAKNTYGTGCFMLMNTGKTPRPSENGLLTTIAWKIGGEVTYCLEGAIFIAGAVVQWLRDGLKIIEQSSDVEQLANSVPDADGVYFVPAFVGLGTPYWDSSARGLIIGLTRGTSQAHIARAAVESMAYQTYDVLETMQQEAEIPLALLKVDGGASINNALMQFQADLLGTAVQRPKIQETTALGAAYLAGLATGIWTDLDEIASHWSLDREFYPNMDTATREAHVTGWRRAVKRSQGWVEE